MNRIDILIDILREIVDERDRQDAKWGGASHDDDKSVAEWVQLIQDYASWARIMGGMDNVVKARRRLMQVAALALAACECLDRKGEGVSE